MDAQEEIEKTHILIKKFTDFLIDAEKDYTLEIWDSGEGKDIILIGHDEDIQQEYKIKFSFYDSGYISVGVEKIEAKEKQKGTDGGNNEKIDNTKS